MKQSTMSRKGSGDRNLSSLFETSQRNLAWAPGVVAYVAALLLTFAVSAAAQAPAVEQSWYQLVPAASPSVRSTPAITYDAAHGQVVMFGGYNGNFLNDTWLWNGTTWTQAFPQNSPSPRSNVQMVYDPARGNVVLFGGLTSVSSRVDDTWIWDGTNWTNVTPSNPASSPTGGRASASMVFDPATNNVVLFGGLNSGGMVQGDTWVWNGTNWTNVTPSNPANSPTGGREGASMAYDPAAGNVVLFGGSDEYGNDQNDTWTWDGLNWTQQNPANPPAPRDGGAMAYDPALGQVVLFGGEQNPESPNYINDTWVWSGTTWTSVNFPNSPGARYAYNQLTYDAAQSQLILFGGSNFVNNTTFDDTWAFGPSQNFGSINVCQSGAPAPCSNTLALKYNFPTTTTIGSILVVTQGATNLDFTQANGGNCAGTISAGNSCTLDVTFAPTAPGLRMGAVELFDSNSPSNLLVTTPIYGVGQAPETAYGPAMTGTYPAVAYSSQVEPVTTLLGYSGLTTDAVGNLYHLNGPSLFKLAPPYNSTPATVADGFTAAYSVAIDGAGNFYVADPEINTYGEVVKLAPGCTNATAACASVIYAPSSLPGPIGVAVDGLGNVFIAQNQTGVFEIPANGGPQFTLYNPPGNSLGGMAVDAAGDLFVTDSGLHHVVEIPAGCTTAGCETTIGTGWSDPQDVAVDAAGDVIVADFALTVDGASDAGGVVEVPAGCTTAGCQILLWTSGGAPDPSAVAVTPTGQIFFVTDGTPVYEINQAQTPSLSFATTYVGVTSDDSPQSVTLQNIGNQNLGAVSPGLVVSGPNFIQVPGSGPSADCTATFLLAPGVACDLGVSFTPQAPGSLISSAVFTDNALNATSASQSVPLSGGALESTEPLNLMGAGTGSGSVSSSPFGISCSLNAGVALPAPPGSCSASYPGGTVVSLEEIPSAGSTFTGWGGACASQGSSQFCNLNTNVGAATNISASFSPVITYTLTVMPAGTGSGTVTDNLAEISCTQTNGVQTGTCSGSYSSSVTLTANATGTSTFVGWGGACASQGASATCTVNVNSVLSVSASFVAPGASQAGTLKPITAGTVYGQGGSFTSANGNNGGVSANSLNQPDGLAVDSGGNLYAADLQNSRVLFYPAGSSTATRIYGQGGSFTSGTQNNGGVSANSLNNPYGLAVDSVGDLYIADENNNRVLFYPAGSTTATRVYGQNGSFTSNAANNGGVSANSLNGPQSVALDSSGNLYVADTLNSRVLFYPAGSTTATQVYGQGGSFSSGTVNNGGISANSLNTPFALTLDSSGDLYVADDKNNRVLFYPYNSTTATRVYGQGGSFATNTANNGGVSANSLNGPQSVAVDSGGNLYVADYFNSRVLSYPFGSTTATRVYGQSNSFTSTSSNTNANSLSNPAALALGSSGNLYVADKSNNRLLEYGSFGNVNVCPSGQTTPAPCNNIVTLSYSSTTTTTFGTTPQVLTQGAPNLDFTLGSGSTCVGTYSGGSSCTVNVNFAPLAPGLRIGAVNLLNIGNNLVASQLLSGVGQGPAAAFSPGAPTTVNTGSFSLLTPAGAAVDAAGDVFIADNGNHRVIKVAANSTVTTVGTGLNYPQGLAVDGAGDLFIADNNLNQVVEVTPAGTQTTIGTGLYAQLGVTVDTAGDVFIADFYTSGPNIQTLSGQVVEVPVGCATSSCQSVVYAPESGMHPIGLAMDAAGDLFIADFSDNPGTTPGKVVEIPAGCTSAGCQTTVGTGWYEPEAVAVDAAGDVFVADEAPKVVEVPVGCANNNNNCQIVVSGILAYGVAVDGKGNVFLPDLHNTPLTDPYSNLVLEINRSLPPSLSFASTNVDSTSSDSPQSVAIQNIGNQTLDAVSPGLVVNGLNFVKVTGPGTPADCSATFALTAGAECNLSISFEPQNAGNPLTSTAVFTDNALNAASTTQTMTLSGVGVQPAPTIVAVPNVVGQTESAAGTALTNVSLTLGSVTTAFSSTVPSGSVISQNPLAGVQVAVGSGVAVLVSSGPQPTSNPLTLENNYFVTGDYASAGATPLRGKGVGGIATGTITIPSGTSSQAVPDGADIIDAFLYWETVENTPSASGGSGTFDKFPISGQQIGTDLPYTDGTLSGTLRVYRADVNAYFVAQANGIRYASGTHTVTLPDAGGSTFPLTEGASMVVIYRVLSPNFPLKSVVIYDGSAVPSSSMPQAVQGFYDALGTSGENTNLFAASGTWNNSSSSVTLATHASQYSTTLNPGSAYAAVIVSTPVTNSDNDGILDAWKSGPAPPDPNAGNPGYYDVKTGSWVPLPGAQHGHKDLFVQLDYMCGAVLSGGGCDPTQENLFPSPDASGNDPLAMVQQAFAANGVTLHLEVGNAVPEDICQDANQSQLCEFPNEPGVISWKNSLEFSKLWPKNFASCAAGGDCSTRFPYGQKDSYHYVLFGHSLAIPAWNSRYGSLTSINVASGVTTIGTTDRGAGINACPSRITISGVLGNPSLNGVYNTTGCADTKTITVATPGVPNWSYPNNTLPEPVIGLTSGTVTSISGYSDLGGSDSAVTLGLWLTAPNQDMSKRANVIAGTLFHEIGHTLGLSHGGLYYDTAGSYVPTFEANCKPNYQSSMNYLFQLDGVGPNLAVAYSNQTLATLYENSLGSVKELTDGSNNPATFSTSAWYVPYVSGVSTSSPATLHCDGSPLDGDTPAYRVNNPVVPTITPAWSNNQNIGYDGVPYTQMRGYNDSTNIDLRQVGATGGEFASLASVLSFGSSSAPLDILAGGTAALGPGGTVALGSGGTVTLGSGGNVTLSSGGTITLGSGGNVTLGSGGNVTLGSGGTVAPGSNGTVGLSIGGSVALSNGGTITLGSGGNVTLGSGGSVTFGSSGGTFTPTGGGTPVIYGAGTFTLNSGGTIALGSGGNITLGSGGNVTLGSGGTIALGSGGNVTLGSGGNVTLGSGGTITLGSGGNITLGSGGNVTLGSGGTIALGSGGNVTLGSGGNVTLGSGGTVTLGSGGDLSLGSGGNITLGSGGSATVGAGGTVTLGSGGNVTLGSGGNVTLGSGGTIALGSGGTITLGSAGNVTLGSGGTITLGSGGTPTPVGPGIYTFSAGGTITLGSGGNITLGSGGNVTLGSGGTITLGSGGTVTLGSGGNVTLGSGGTIALGSGGTIALGSGGNIALGSGGTIALGSGGNVTLGSGGNVTLGSGGNVTLGSGGTLTNELTYETANSIVRPPSSPTETPTGASVRVDWTAPAFGVVQTYTIYRSINNGTPVVIGSVSGNPPATEFIDTNPDTTPGDVVVYTITTTLAPVAIDPTQRQSPPSAPAVLKNDQSIALGPLPSSVVISQSTVTVTATAMSSGIPNGLQVNFSATGSCAIGSQTIASNVSSATVTLNSTGSCTINASQPGTNPTPTGIAPYYNAANAVSGTFMILPQGSGLKAQTITWATLPNAQYGGTFSLSASSSSGLQVSFVAAGQCSTNGTISGVGVCKITASAPGSSMYSAASVTQSFTVFPAVLKVTATNVSIAYGQTVPSFTYSYSGFVNNQSASVVSGAPVLSTTATAASNPGNYPITVSTGTLSAANYSFLYVNGTLTILGPLVTVSPSNIAFGTVSLGSITTKNITVTNTGNAPVTIKDPILSVVKGGNSNEFVAVNLCLTPLAAGKSCTITIAFLAGPFYTPQTATLEIMDNAPGSPQPVTLSATVLQPQTITFTINPPASAVYNSSFMVAATGGASGNAVTLTSAGACTNSGARYTMTSGTGTCSVIANQAGNSTYASAAQVTKTVTATLAAQTISFTTGPPSSAVYKSSFMVAATGGASGNSVNFTSSGACSNAGATYTMTSGTGTCSVIANQAGNTNYAAAAAVTKTVTATYALASLKPTSLSFGTVSSGKSSTAQTATLSNTGTTPLIISSIGFTGSNPSNFSQTNTCPSSSSSLAAGKSCSISVTFNSSGKAASSNLTVTDNTQVGTQSVSVSGN